MDLRVTTRLPHDSHLVVEWLESNYMKRNQDKCHRLVSGYKHEKIWVRIEEVKISESCKKLIGLVIDRDLSFNMFPLSVKKLGENYLFYQD